VSRGHSSPQALARTSVQHGRIASKKDLTALEEQFLKGYDQRKSITYGTRLKKTQSLPVEHSPAMLMRPV
jgi:hypothetical protein